ncbi:phosphoribosylanthranilate isomerase [Ancylobacter sp. 6x-1]|uniref:N-(5'-phosphoribosyl)anthranilate isomerase n=1 Tax=Ancylobacter crimeensis TaxID=2579147 RepID=A0ABT0DD95_9HYPH|nr:phosphoribosylanthranilate isomerase [Ancylobacter crimeensis]
MSLDIKICGLSTPETLDAALGAGADLVGLVFFAKSPRNVTLDTARRLAARARGRASLVALTVDATDAELAAIIEKVSPDLLQLHGHEGPERVAAIRARFGRPVMKAVGIAEAADVAAARAYEGAADRLLLDAKPPRGAMLPGGNGLPFDWSLIADFTPAGPDMLDGPKPFMLSGGLTPETVGEALRLTRAPGVDVSSGVESAPGVKDPERIVAFVQAARAAARHARGIATSVRAVSRRAAEDMKT